MKSPLPAVFGKVLLAATLTLCAIGKPAVAEDAKYPSQTIRIVVPFAAGGTADALARVVAENLAQRWSSPVIVENMPSRDTARHGTTEIE